MESNFKIIKKILTTLFLLVISQCVFSQITNNLIKYWYYRNRLNNYFVIPGEKIGESQIVCYRNKFTESTEAADPYKMNVDYGQHGKY
jgi:hypothetical protein